VRSVDVLLVDVAGVLLIVWLFNLIRRGRLYVGYGAIFVLVTAAGLVALSIPALLQRFNRLGTLLYSAAGLVVLAIAFVLLMLIYILSQLTQLSNRVTLLAQELALRRATEMEQGERDVRRPL
jgi:uncharacterized membrane protein YcjF (UPF0283 family)